MPTLRAGSRLVVVLILLCAWTTVASAAAIYYEFTFSPRGSFGQVNFMVATSGYVTGSTYVDLVTPVTIYGQTFTRMNYGFVTLGAGDPPYYGYTLRPAVGTTINVGDTEKIEINLDPAATAPGSYDISNGLDTSVWVKNSTSYDILTGSGSQMVVYSDNPTLVTMGRMWTECQRGRVKIGWTTTSEIGTVGFRVRRSDGVGPFDIISRLIPGAGGATTSASYSWIDSNVDAGAKFYYIIEEIDDSGIVTQFGPLTVQTPKPERRRR